MKTTKTRFGLTAKAEAIFFSVLLSFTVSNSQSFNLSTVKPADKVAQSKFFTIDSNKVINQYEGTSFTTPVVRVLDSLFIVAGVHSQISFTKNSATNQITGFSLSQNYPNPFNPSTTIQFNVGKKARISVVLFDMMGREVAKLVDDNKEAGSYSVVWSGTNASGVSVASGTYLYRMLATTDDGTRTVETKKLTLLK